MASLVGVDLVSVNEKFTNLIIFKITQALPALTALRIFSGRINFSKLAKHLLLDNMRAYLMKKITMLLAACIFFGQTSFADTSNAIAVCDDVVDNDIGRIMVSQITGFPGNLQVAVLYRDGSHYEVSVGMHEWRQKSFTLPSRKNSNYRLLFWEKQWMLFQDDVSNVKQKRIDCRLI